MTRLELLTLVLEDLDRTDISQATQSSWVLRAEQRIERELRMREMIKRDIVNLTDDTFLAPDDFIQAEDVSIYPLDITGLVVVGGPRKLEYRSQTEITNLRRAYEMQAIAVTPAAPAVIAFTGNVIELFPSPTLSAIYMLPMWQLSYAYYAKLPPLVQDSDTNWLLSNKFDLYFNAIQIYAYRFLKEWDVATQTDAMLSADIAVLNMSAEKADKPGRLVARSNTPIGVKRGYNWR